MQGAELVGGVRRSRRRCCRRRRSTLFGAEADWQGRFSLAVGGWAYSRRQRRVIPPGVTGQGIVPTRPASQLSIGVADLGAPYRQANPAGEPALTGSEGMVELTIATGYCRC